MSQANTFATAPREQAPSEVHADNPMALRILGVVSLFPATLGIAAIIANQYGPRWIGEGSGYILAAFGILGLLIHALRDTDIEIRRVYGAAGALLIVAAFVIGVLPGKPEGATEALAGYRFFPWGAMAATLGLMFFTCFARNESDPTLSLVAEMILNFVGFLACTLAIVLGLFSPTALVGPCVVLALLGLGFYGAYFTLPLDVGTPRTLLFPWFDFESLSLKQGSIPSDDRHRAATLLGILGVIAVLIALGRTVAPGVLHDGPSILKKLNQSYDIWKVLGRVAMIALGLLGVLTLRWKSWPLWMRASAALVGVAWIAVFLVGSFANPLAKAPEPYMIPYGIILLGIGLAFVSVAVLTTSDSHLIVLTRRELSSYFYSPIAYIVLVGMAASSALGYYIFVDGLVGGPPGTQIPEPIVRSYQTLTIFAAIQTVFLVPLLTMRTFSEEKRTGTLEVLLTAPVQESTIVLSKFISTWIFFLLSWAPAAIYLIGFRIVGGQPFDFKPLLSYYAALAACGVSFVGLGIFLSSLTKNQIVSASLTGALLFAQLLTVIVRQSSSEFFSPGVRVAFGKLDYLTLWGQALGGLLPVSDVILQLSLGVFWIFLTIKVLEIRKWG